MPDKIVPLIGLATGSGRVDALAAINAIDMGNILFTELSFSDENNNGHINTEEEIKLNLEFENTSEESYNNVTAKLTCTNDLVEIKKGNAEIGSIAAKQTFNIEDKFTRNRVVAHCHKHVYKVIAFDCARRRRLLSSRIDGSQYYWSII